MDDLTKLCDQDLLYQFIDYANMQMTPASYKQYKEAEAEILRRMGNNRNEKSQLRSD